MTTPPWMEEMRQRADDVRAKDVLTAIRRGVNVLLEPEAVAELRILNTNRGTVSGYFDSLDKLVEAARAWDGKALGIYVTLNPVLPSLLSRSVNRVKPYARHTTSDQDILRRRWLPLDFDPVRPAGISSTDAEHVAALARAREACAWLSGPGWPQPVLLDSGNGAGVLYRVDLPNNAEAAMLIQRCLDALDFQFSDDRVDLDKKVGNAARLWKVPGTMACKGDPTPDRPHRQSEILEVPDKLELVSLSFLEKLAALAPGQANAEVASTGGQLDVDAWLATHGVPVVSSGAWRDCRKYCWRLVRLSKIRLSVEEARPWSIFLKVGNSRS